MISEGDDVCFAQKKMYIAEQAVSFNHATATVTATATATATQEEEGGGGNQNEALRKKNKPSNFSLHLGD